MVRALLCWAARPTSRHICVSRPFEPSPQLFYRPLSIFTMQGLDRPVRCKRARVLSCSLCSMPLQGLPAQLGCTRGFCAQGADALLCPLFRSMLRPLQVCGRREQPHDFFCLVCDTTNEGAADAQLCISAGSPSRSVHLGGGHVVQRSGGRGAPVL